MLYTFVLLSLVTLTQTHQLLTHPSFETIGNYWDGWFCAGCQSNRNDDDVVDGNFSVSVTDRIGHWAGIRQRGLHTSMAVGSRYTTYGYVKLHRNIDPSISKHQNIRFTLEYKLQDETNKYERIAESRNTADDGWIRLGGDFVFTDYGQPLVDLHLYIDGMDPGVNYTIDDCHLYPLNLDLAWRAAAQATISGPTRKGDTMKVTVRTWSGFRSEWGFINGSLQVKQIENEFGFGAEVDAFHLENEAGYQDFVLSNFKWATPRKDLSWRETEFSRNRLTWESADKAINILEDAGKRIRGDSLFDARKNKNPEWVQLISRPDDLFRVCMKRIDDVLTRYRYRMNHWIVNKRMLEESFYALVFQTEEIREYMFNNAHLNDPAAQLYLEEDGLLLNGKTYMTAADMAVKMQNRGLHIKGLATSLNWVGDLADEDAALLAYRLSKLAESGVPLWLSDVSVENEDETARGQTLRDLITLIYGQPGIVGMSLGSIEPGLQEESADRALMTNVWPAGLTLNSAGQAVREELSLYSNRKYGELFSTVGPNEIHEFTFQDLEYGDYQVSIVHPDGREIKTTTISLLPHKPSTDYTFWI